MANIEGYKEAGIRRPKDRLKMDIIEVNECLRHFFGGPEKGNFDEEVGEAEGEPQPQIEERVQIRQAREASWLEAQQAEETKTEEQWVELEEEYAAIEGLDDYEVDKEVEEVSEVYEVDKISIDDYEEALSITVNY